MRCEKCESEKLLWRCDNHETNMTKYKCADCGHIISKQISSKTPLFNEQEMQQFNENKKKLMKEIRRKSAKELWKDVDVRNYTKTKMGKWSVNKTICGKCYYAGTYKTEEQAKKVVEKLNECNWDMEQLPRIKEEILK